MAEPKKRSVLIPTDDVLVCVDCVTLFSKKAAEADPDFQRETWRGDRVLVCPDDRRELEEPHVRIPAVAKAG